MIAPPVLVPVPVRLPVQKNKNFLATPVQRILKAPYSKHNGTTIKVPGKFWGSGVPAKDQDTLFLVRVISSQDDYKVNPKVFLCLSLHLLSQAKYDAHLFVAQESHRHKPAPFFKVMSVEKDDPNSTSNVELEEGRNFWWFSVATFSTAYYAHADREKAASDAAAAAEGAALTANDSVYVPSPPTPYQEKASAFKMLYDVSPATRLDKKGNRHTCMFPGCGKEYFVAKGSNPPHKYLWVKYCRT
jgi:hypothetical protein